jgi:glyoxylase-like metal-dependent hydrolase (beta-lactamase superfamily II)
MLLTRTLTLRRSAVATATQRPFHSSAISQARNNMRVIPIPVRKDNYSYLVVDDAANEAAAVDPYTPSKVKEAADQLGVKVVAGITTHHHHDHSGGNQVSLSLVLFSSLTPSPSNKITVHRAHTHAYCIYRNSCVAF